MRLRRTGLLAVAATVVAAAGLAVALLAATRGQAARPGPGALPAQDGAAPASSGPAGAGAGGFGWLHPRPAPAGWAQAGLPGHAAVLSYPRWLARQTGDAGTVTEGLISPAGSVLVYLNVTPQQGDESLPGWPGFRLAHLREDGNTAVQLDGRSADVGFRGGQGRCVIDDYITRIHSNHYREIACFVRAAKGGSVLVATTRAADWGQYGSVLEKAVSAYQAG